MRGKLAAFGALIVAFGLFEFFFFPRPTAMQREEPLIPHLLPPVIGHFRSARRWKSYPASHTLEVGATYRHAGIEADLDFWLGAWTPHNAVACWYVRGTPMLWQHLEEVRTARSNAVFDLALFHDPQGFTLFADTECYPAGCRERAIVEKEGLQWPLLEMQTAAPVPVSVLVRSSRDPQSARAAREQLVQDFRRFAAQLNLSPLLENHESGDRTE